MLEMTPEQVAERLLTERHITKKEKEEVAMKRRMEARRKIEDIELMKVE